MIDSKAMVQNSQFIGLKSAITGGAFFSTNSDFTIKQCKFSKNQSPIGGAISIHNNPREVHEYIIQNNSFELNFATVKGGAIFFDQNIPKGIDSNQFDYNNYAPYGPNYASYPASVQLISYDKNIIASGQPYTGKLLFKVIDTQSALINIDNNSNLRITQTTGTSSVTGQKQVTAQNGIGQFDQLTFYAQPGSMNVPFLVYTISINTQQVISVLNQSDINFEGDVNSALVYFDFRLCQLCGQGTFSFALNSSECYNCVKNARCLGGDLIEVESGYWRSSINSTNIIACSYTKACLGGSSAPKILKNSITMGDENPYLYPLCQTGYGGNLCQKCLNVDGVQYVRAGKGKCARCPANVGNVIKLIGVFIAVFIGFAFLIYINLKNEKESPLGIVSKIFTNYLQMVSFIALFNLGWPNYLVKYFNGLSQIGETAQTFISFDCFLQGTQFYNTDSSLQYFKTILITIVPLIYMTLFTLAFYLINVFDKSNIDLRAKFLKRIKVSVIVIVYAILPTIVRYNFGLFFCRELDPGEQWLGDDLEIRCWTSDHVRWIFMISVPSIAIWVIGMPLWGFLVLFRHRKTLESTDMQSQYKALYLGLQAKCYYWEFVNILRKFFLVVINVALVSQDGVLKSWICLMILIGFWKLLLYIQPYKDPLMNILEEREHIISLVTFFGSFFFLMREISDSIQMIVFTFVILVNLWFVLLCVFVIAKNFKNRRAQQIAGFLRKYTISSDIQNLELIHSLKIDDMLDKTAFEGNQNILNQSNIEHESKVNSDNMASLFSSQKNKQQKSLFKNPLGKQKYKTLHYPKNLEKVQDLILNQSKTLQRQMTKRATRNANVKGKQSIMNQTKEASGTLNNNVGFTKNNDQTVCISNLIKGDDGYDYIYQDYDDNKKGNREEIKDNVFDIENINDQQDAVIDISDSQIFKNASQFYNQQPSDNQAKTNVELLQIMKQNFMAKDRYSSKQKEEVSSTQRNQTQWPSLFGPQQRKIVDEFNDSMEYDIDFEKAQNTQSFTVKNRKQSQHRQKERDLGKTFQLSD